MSERDESVEPEDSYAAARASLDQISAHHDEMAVWLGDRAAALRQAGLPDEIVTMMLARLVDVVLPVSNPIEDMLAALAQEAQRRIEAEQEREDDD